jgi:hypothetical protein
MEITIITHSVNSPCLPLTGRGNFNMLPHKKNKTLFEGNYIKNRTTFSGGIFNIVRLIKRRLRSRPLSPDSKSGVKGSKSCYSKIPSFNNKRHASFARFWFSGLICRAIYPDKKPRFLKSCVSLSFSGQRSSSGSSIAGLRPGHISDVVSVEKTWKTPTGFKKWKMVADDKALSQGQKSNVRSTIFILLFDMLTSVLSFLMNNSIKRNCFIPNTKNDNNKRSYMNNNFNYINLLYY